MLSHKMQNSYKCFINIVLGAPTPPCPFPTFSGRRISVRRACLSSPVRAGPPDET
jgi:hypothetical protein